MLNYSFSTVLMAVLTSNLIIIAIAICFRSNKILLSVGYKLLAAFLIFTLIRFAFPLEINKMFDLGISRNIVFPEFLSIILTYFRTPLFVPFGLKISLWTFFEVIWVVGIIYQVVRYLRELYKYEYFVACWSEDVTEEDPYHSCLLQACGDRKNSFQILKLPEIPSPCLYGIRRPRILIPADMEITDQDLYYVLRHEVSHHYHHDLVIKRIVSILCMLYWWNPICSVFQKQVDKLLEIRIDDSLVQKDPKVSLEYLSALVHIVENMEGSIKGSNDFIVSLSQKNSSALAQRFEMVCNKRPHVNILLSGGLLTLIIVMYIGSYLITFENRYLIESDNVDNTAALVDAIYAVPRDDGTYDIYCGEFLMENVETLNNYYSDIPIYNQ